MDLEEKLICLVQKHTCLYDINSRYYSDKISKQNAWEVISKEIGMSVAQCTQKWTRIRDNYRKGLKSREKGSGSSASKRRPLKYEKELTFLKSYMQGHDQKSNLDSQVSPETLEYTQNSDKNMEEENIDRDSDMQSLLSQPSNTNVRSSVTNARVPRSISIRQSQGSITKERTETVSDVLKNYLESKAEQDPVCLFFSAMAENVKKLPDRLQLEVRQKVFNVVSDAELKWLNERDDGNNVYRGYCTNQYSTSSYYQTSSYVASSVPATSTITTTPATNITQALDDYNDSFAMPVTPTRTTALSYLDINTE